MTRRRKLKLAAATLLATLTLVIIIVATWMARLDAQITERFAGKRFAPPVEFYSAPESIRVGSTPPKKYFEDALARKRFRVRAFGQPLQAGDFSLWAAAECRSVVPLTELQSAFLAKCVAFRNSHDIAMRATRGVNEDSVAASNENANSSVSASESAQPPQIAAFDEQGKLIAAFIGSAPIAAPGVVLEPELFAQYYGDKATLRTVVPLGAVPNDCINALLAIEDSGFWEHSGVSPVGLARAALVFLRSGHASQGGSTITQQLVKNYFLTDERTLRRKITEFAMALLVETRQSKSDILETYINLIYMGQNGAFQVRGWGAAADHYFGRDVQSLSLPQCATLAATVASPGLYSPFTKPENASKRRARVLDRMVELKMISSAQAVSAKASPLPMRPARAMTEPAPYFVQAVHRQLQSERIDEADGLRVYTTLNVRAQEAAQQAVRSSLERLEAGGYPRIQKLKAEGKHLEAALLAADPATGQIQAVVGGRNYLATQYNRAFDSHRQVGSVMKPFVYLSALESSAPDGKPYSPMTILKDESFTHSYQGQKWSPKNYDGKFFGDVPMFFALKESLNSATAQLGLAVGLGKIVDLAQRMGVKSPIDPLPSLTLGAFELYPSEVLQAYGTISRFGSQVPLTYMKRVENLDGREMYAYAPTATQAVAPEATAELVGMMKQTLLTGTARGARMAGFVHPAAGKTGTTNDKKDAWFAGFTPYHAAVVWIGYDDNTPHGLTGASGAVPLWTAYMKAYGASFPPDDFAWPAGTQVATVPADLLQAMNVPLQAGVAPGPVELVFKAGEVPAGAVVVVPGASGAAGP